MKRKNHGRVYTNISLITEKCDSKFDKFVGKHMCVSCKTGMYVASDLVHVQVEKTNDLDQYNYPQNFGHTMTKRPRFNTCSSSARDRSAVTKTCITFDLIQNNYFFFTKNFVRDCRFEWNLSTFTRRRSFINFQLFKTNRISKKFIFISAPTKSMKSIENFWHHDSWMQKR